MTALVIFLVVIAGLFITGHCQDKKKRQKELKKAANEIRATQPTARVVNSLARFQGGTQHDSTLAMLEHQIESEVNKQIADYRQTMEAWRSRPSDPFAPITHFTPPNFPKRKEQQVAAAAVGISLAKEVQNIGLEPEMFLRLAHTEERECIRLLRKMFPQEVYSMEQNVERALWRGFFAEMLAEFRPLPDQDVNTHAVYEGSPAANPEEQESSLTKDKENAESAAAELGGRMVERLKELGYGSQTFFKLLNTDEEGCLRFLCQRLPNEMTAVEPNNRHALWAGFFAALLPEIQAANEHASIREKTLSDAHRN